jgi:hypothetical protein
MPFKEEKQSRFRELPDEEFNFDKPKKEKQTKIVNKKIHLQVLKK